MTQEDGPLDLQQLESFREMIQRIVDLEHEFERTEDYEASNNMINQLYDSGLSPEDFNTFQQVIDMANDPDTRRKLRRNK